MPQITLFIDEIAQSVFPKENEAPRRYGDIFEELFEHLIKARDRADYTHIFFAGEESQGFVLVKESFIEQRGVFSVYKPIKKHYDKAPIRNYFNDDKRKTLVVAVNNQVADRWQEELENTCSYSVIRI